MQSISAQTDSIIGIISAIDNETVVLPEFQRDFRWEMERTYDLFDSIARGIFIGTIIYGKPSFAVSCRDIDIRPRRGKGSRAKIDIKHYSDEEIAYKTQTENFRLILDGQQRLTSIYRAIKGNDRVYLILKKKANFMDASLEDNIEVFSGEDKSDYISISLHLAYLYDKEGWREDFLKEKFLNTKFAKKNFDNWSDIQTEKYFVTYLNAVKNVVALFKREKLVAYYLLDMNLDKFTLFFERSNSRGIQLNFTDILAAKLYVGFNLRAAIDEFQSENNEINLNRELIIRAVAYLTSDGKEIEKNYILKQLKPNDFDKYWQEVCDLYVTALNYLIENHFIVSQSWMPSENMLLPLMVFLREIKGKILEEEQRRFVEYWFWASLFAQRYSGSSNEVMLEDARILKGIANREAINDSIYLNQLRSRVTDADDILAYRRKSNNIYKGLLNLVNYEAGGVLDWTSQNKLKANQTIQDHHIFPKAFIRKNNLYKGNFEAQELIDCVANRALISKINNLKIGAKPPSQYMAQISSINKNLKKCLQSHLIDDIIMKPELDDIFVDFVRQRASAMYDLVEKYVIIPSATFTNFFPSSLSDNSQDAISIFADYKGHRVTAQFYKDNNHVDFNNQITSPSSAALNAIHSVGGTERISENGWVFWKYIDEYGNESTIDNLRD